MERFRQLNWKKGAFCQGWFSASFSYLTRSLGSRGNAVGSKRVWKAWLKAGEAAASHNQFRLSQNRILTEAAAQRTAMWAEDLLS